MLIFFPRSGTSQPATCILSKEKQRTEGLDFLPQVALLLEPGLTQDTRPILPVSL